MIGTRERSVGFLVAAACLWSMGGLFIKLVDWNPLAIAGARSAVAALFLLAVKRRPHFTWSWPQIGAALSYAAAVVLFVVATKLTTAANAILLQYTAPIYVALLGSWFLGERASVLDWGVILVVIAGFVLFFFDQLTPAGFWGNVCAILSGFTYAMLAVLLRKQKDGSPVESVVLGNLLAAAIGIPFVFAAVPGLRDWGIVVFLGVVQLGLSYLLYSSAIRHVRAVDAILIVTIEPILNPLWVFLFLGEVPGRWSILGGLIILLTVTARGVVMARGRRSVYQ